jgi:glucan biosynthesis protein C
MAGRKYHLDWLRVLAFGLLIPFHAAMLYVRWWYPLKSPRLVPSLEWPLMLLTPWRMALVFVISGVACHHLIARLGAGGFARDRLRRLVPVILTGMLAVNAFQSWAEHKAQSTTQLGFLAFWPHYLAMPRWDHLWFLVYLLPYTLLFALAWRLKGARNLPRIPLAVLLLAPAIWLVVTGMVVDRIAPRTDALFNDWGQHLKWLGLFAAGVALAMREDAWAWLQDHCVPLLGATLALALQVLVDHALFQRGLLSPPWDWITWNLATGLYGWAAILTLLGFAAHYLSRPSPQLAYLNTAILPVYVLHQPILIGAAWQLFGLALPLPLEAAMLVAITAFGALALYHFAIRPFRVTRFLFGLK